MAPCQTSKLHSVGTSQCHCFDALLRNLPYSTLHVWRRLDVAHGSIYIRYVIVFFQQLTVPILLVPVHQCFFVGKLVGNDVRRITFAVGAEKFQSSGRVQIERHLSITVALILTPSIGAFWLACFGKR